MKANKDEESEEDDSSDDNFYGDEDDNQNQKAESPEAKKEGKYQQTSSNGHKSFDHFLEFYDLSFIWFTNFQIIT